MFSLLLRRCLWVLAFVVSSSALQAQPLPASRSCATLTLTPAETRASFETVRAWRSGSGHTRGVITIPVAFHVIHDGAQGDVSDEQVAEHIAVLNEAFLPIGFEFVLASVDRTENAGWYFNLDLESPEELAMKEALAHDPARFLNIYTVRPAGGITGWTYFPFSLPEDDIRHGLVLLNETLPGGDYAPYNLGDSAVHELGHWMGLLHLIGPCEGGDTFPTCETTGDGVCDTPAMSEPAFGCPVGQDSCPTSGPDPIHNYMAFTTDACMSEFTPGQGERAHAVMQEYRPTIVSGTTAAAPGADPGGAILGPAYPNPMRKHVTVPFTLDRARAVTLRVYDETGRLVATLAEGRTYAAGDHSLRWEAGTVPSGLYVARLSTGDIVRAEQIVRLR